MASVLVVAPHPDDETLGCGGTLLKHKAAGDTMYWLIVTTPTAALGFTPEKIEKRQKEIAAVAKDYGFSKVFELGFPSAVLDTVAKSDLVQAFSKVCAEAKPEVCYMPNPGDAHSDHAACFDAAMSATKWFRCPSVKKLLVYETLSETHFKPTPGHVGFMPNYYVDISKHLDRKIEIMEQYVGEMAAFPFPRSEEALRALATVRGSEAGAKAAEAFVLLKQIA